MENTLLVGLSRQIALRRELDVVANNVANVGTTGFKGESTLFREFLAGRAREHTFPMQDQRVSMVIDRATRTDFSQGPIEHTRNTFDLAIQGEGYFTIETPQGERYTRAGSFTTNATGELVTMRGDRVLGDGGPIQFDPQDTDVNIAADGTISTRAGERGRIRLVRFENENALQRQGENLFSASAQPENAGPATRIMQGAIEKSNVRPVIELSRMIEITRNYTNIANMMNKTDELRRDAIQRLADVPA